MDSLIQTLLSLLQTEFGTTFKDYTWGDQKVYNRTELPAILVMPQKTLLERSGTVRDSITHTVTIRIIVDMKNYLKESGAGDVLLANQQLVKWFEETDANGEILSTGTVFSVLNKNMTVSGFELYSRTFSVNYDDDLISTKDSLLKKADLVVEFRKRGIRPS